MSDMAQLISVKLSRFDGSPWGFRLQGGKDFGTPLVVQKVNGGSPAEAAGLRAGDAVIKVNNTDTYNLKHKDAQDVIVKAGNSFEVTVQRGGNTWRPSVSPVTPSIPSPQPHAPVNNIPPVTKTSLAANKQDVQHIGSGHNFAPKPFSNGNSDGAPIKSIVNKQYNSPVGIYSEQTIAETLSAQAEVLAGGVLGVNFKKNEKNYDAQNSEVFRMVQEADKEPKTPEPAEPIVNGGVVSSPLPTLTGLRSVSAPETKPQPTTPQNNGLPPGQNICADCERLIVGLFVRIKEKNLHVECFKCSTCGTSLKNVGYYNINNKLYCDIHAKLVARQQSTQGSIPTTVSTGGGKAPVGTITAALGNLGIDSPKSPPPPPQPLNGTSITAPFALQNYNRRPNSDLGNLPRGYIRPAEYITDNNNEENKKICDEKIYTSTITIKTGNETNHLGNQPNDTPTYRPLQTPTLGGGNKSIGSTGLAPTLNYSSANNNNNNNNSSSINSFIRPQSQTVTESYHEECDYYEEVKEIKETKEIIKQKTEEPPRPPSSVRSKSLAWPPVKNLEDSSYPTASPIWVDPNPILSRLPRQNVPEKRLFIQENRSQNVSRASNREEREYDQRDVYYSRNSEIMDNSCNKPFYRKECIETRRECRSSSSTRPDSAEGMRRSLTPTRINQPTPKPWIATVTSETNTFSHVEAPVPPEPPVCRKVCTCEIVCERTTGPGGPEHEQEHKYRKIVCEICTPEPPPVEEYEEPQEPEPEEEEEQEYEEENYEIVDMAKVVPPDVAVCPRGVENQHNMYTETTEKDEGNMHIKKTTIYEKTVELLSPSRAGTPVEGEEENGRASAASADREVECISGRHQYSESADVVSSAIETSRMMEEAKREEEEQRRAIQEERRIEQERIQREKEECRIREENRLRIIQQEKEEKQRRVQQQKKETERVCRQEEEERCGKHVSFASRSQGVVQESVQPSEVYESQQYVREEKTCSTKTEECCQNLREQVEVHKNLREQQQPERRTLQERRLEKRFRPQSAEEKQAAEAAARAKESMQRKHVQFVTKTDSGNVRPLPQSTVKNSTPKEWRSEMVNALTTVSDRPYSPFETTTTCCSVQENNECQSKTTVTRKTRYEEICRPCPAQKPQPVKPPPYVERPISPFTEALTTASERPYTPLGGDHEQDTVICVKRSRTPTDKTIEGYCHPAEILYTDAKTRQSRSREKKLRKVEGPRPLPTPPPDYKFRDASVSPTRSLSRPETPSRQGVMAGLKKPGTIPSYQKYLVAEECEAVHENSYTPSRTPTPTPHRPKSPAPGPPQAPACYIKAHAPMIRADPPPARQPFNPVSTQPGQTEKISYHLEEDTPQGHLSRDYQGTRTSYSENSQRNTQSYSCQQQQQQQQQYQESSVSSQSKQQLGDWDGSGCGINKVSDYQPSLSCPLKNAPPSRPVTPCQSISQSTCISQCNYESSNSQAAISERVQKQGVRVLPPCPKIQPTQQTQVCQKRQTYQSEEERTMSTYNVQKSSHQESDCANTGVTVMPCRTTTSSGVSRTGVVIIPCEGEDNDACPRSGICITPTPDRSGLCVSPAQHGRSSARCSGPNKDPRSAGNQVDVGNCPASGIRVGTCSDGSICVAPCKVPGVAPVQAPKPILKTQCPSAKTIPFPHIPLPGKAPAPEPNPCDSCPLNNQCEQSSQQINQQPRTNLSNQLTRMTIKRDKHVVQLFKPQTQSSQQQQKCDDSESCQLQQQPYRSPPNQSRPSYTPDTRKVQNLPAPTNLSSQPDLGCGLGGASPKSRRIAGNSAPTRGRGILNQAGSSGRQPLCASCNAHVRGPFITALGQIWCPEHFVCVNSQCNRPLQDIGFVQEKGQLYCEYCFERFIAPACNKCNNKIKGDSLTAIGKHFHPECFSCTYCGKLFGNSPFFLEDGLPYCEADWNELFTTKCYACGFPVEAGDRWVEALNNNYHSQCFNCSTCKANLEGQSFYAKGGRPFCKNHAR
ncbi:PDZ and LIM domain protein Zasp isoform X4 [Aphidius gifuensis]|uniref:PDZ and LIM domain protein Zasp isoform X4 n=1 Tax=Aphidius gifuensis TaxID=684658 RepID=UPI001CDC2CEE|nr:PDZ and LIM domain protein Zasp isoform X4 [Aphidius gifuensis]